jgi:hypothetical protein
MLELSEPYQADQFDVMAASLEWLLLLLVVQGIEVQDHLQMNGVHGMPQLASE